MRSTPRLLTGRALMLAASAACLFACAAAAGAQTMARPGPPGGQTTVLSPAKGRPPPPRGLMNDALPDPARDDLAKVAAARDFILVYHPQLNPLNVSAKIERFMPRMIQAAKQQDPKLDVKKFVRERQAMLMQQSANVLNMQSHVVSRHFSMQELKGLAGFYRGPLGRKLTDETPKIAQEVMQASRMTMMIPPGQMKMHVQPSAQGAPAGAPHK